MEEADLIAALKSVSTATIWTRLHKVGVTRVLMDGVNLVSSSPERLAGRAFTVRQVPAREDVQRVLDDQPIEDDLLRQAIETIPEGGVLTLDCRGELDAAVCGEIFVERLRYRGAAGLVSDGAIRDAPSLVSSSFPIFAGGAAAPQRRQAHLTIDMNVPIACGGVAVFPGDVLVGDRDGVVCIPQALVDSIITSAVDQEQLEAFLLEQV